MVPTHLADRLISAVVVGASAGAIEMLGRILPDLPATTPFPIVVVVHLPPRRPSLLVELFAPRCKMAVREARQNQPVSSGTVWFAPPDYHLMIENDRTFAVSLEPPVNFSRPSIDVLFESASDVYGGGLACLVLTGASGDGAEGARAIQRAGGMVVVQDPATAEASLLPESVMERITPDAVLVPDEIAELLQRTASRGS